MTQTFAPLDPATLEGKTRAALLEMCQAAGFKATGWKRDRMFSALTGAEQPAPEKKANKLAEQTLARSLERQDEDSAKKARENRAKRTGACEATTCRERCEAYAFGWKDAFHWDLCVCGHTQWAHAQQEQA